jgi:hypothetical protein
MGMFSGSPENEHTLADDEHEEVLGQGRPSGAW